MAGSSSHVLVGVGRWLRKELAALWPVFLFFLIGFLLLILLINVALGEFSIEVRVISNAVIGALLAAKAALILDETSLERSLQRYRRIVAVASKVLLYGLTSLLLLYIERVLEALHKFGNLDAALQHVSERGARWIMLWALGISIVFALYFAFVEINERMGQGELWRLFFESPKIAHDTGGASNIKAGTNPS